MKLKIFKYYKLCIFFIAMFALIPAKVYAANIPSPTQEFYVNDFADVLTDEEEKAMLDKAVNLASEELGIQIVVTTIKSLNGENLETYANDMYNQYRIGKDDMGALILLVTEDRDTRIELGTAMEAYITDAKAGRLLDNYAIPDFKENRFNSGLVSVQDALINEASTIKTQMVERAQKEAQRQERLEAIGNFFKGLLKVIGWMLLFGTPIGLIAFLIYKAYQKHKAKQAAIDELIQFKADAGEEIERLKREKETIEDEAKEESSMLKSEIKDLEQSNSELKKKLDDAKIIYPTLEEDLNKYSVKDLNSEIKEYSSLIASRNLVSKFAGIISAYDELTNAQKKYVSSDYSKIKSLYSESLALEKEYVRKQKNEVALGAVLGILGAISIGKNSNLSKLKEGMNLYNGLDEDYKEKFGSQKLGLLKTLLSQAERDHARVLREQEEERRRKRREEEEEEERRRRQRMNSYNSNSSSSSFHGFGGHGGGAGASRHF